MTISDLRAGMLVRRVTTGKVYRVNAHYGDSPAISTNDNGTWVSVRAQRDGSDFGRVRGFHPEELEPVNG